ncbi:MAG: PhoH family protein [Pseudanabaenaceae cyanobacterium bins.68]|nr:PhoH family protein [Pseudanabaenaceae cyanobacterium bins.68]
METLVFAFPSPGSAIALAGSQEENLKYLSLLTQTHLVMRGQELLIKGEPSQTHLAQALIELLQTRWQHELTIAKVDIETAHSTLRSNLSREWQRQISKTAKGRLVQARTFNQRQYVQAIETHPLTFGIGPAGTGKTYLAAVVGIKALQNHQIERLVLTRPAVEAGEKLGFLPGDLQQKIDPYLRPLYDALHEMIGADKVPQLIEKGAIEIAPLAYMRGRTLSNAFIIVDEAQNTTAAQMKMILTRLGENSRMVVTGDITQTDLPRHQRSGLEVAQKILQGIEGVAFTYFQRGDVVRHPLVQEIIAAYEQLDQAVASRPVCPTRD